MDELRVVIADDESMARSRLRRLLGAHDDVRIVAECTDGHQVEEAIRLHRADAAFLDIRMPGPDGIELAACLDIPIVLTTAHDRAIEAFRHGVVDYLLKPITAARLGMAVDRLRADHRPGVLVIDTPRGEVRLPLSSIRACCVDGESVVVHAERPHYTTRTMASLESELPAPFERVHRRAIVNLDRVRRLEDLPSGGYRAHLDDGLTVVFSRAAARRYRRERR